MTCINKSSLIFHHFPVSLKSIPVYVLRFLVAWIRTLKKFFWSEVQFLGGRTVYLTSMGLLRLEPGYKPGEKNWCWRWILRSICIVLLGNWDRRIIHAFTGNCRISSVRQRKRGQHHRVWGYRHSFTAGEEATSSGKINLLKFRNSMFPASSGSSHNLHPSL